MKRVLVTGASGCIGRFVVPALVARGWQVHAVASRSRSDLPSASAWHIANLLDVATVDELLAAVRPTHLLHLAWSLPPGRWATAPENVSWVSSTLHLAEQFLEHGGIRFVGAGSCLEYDWEFGFCREAVTPRVPATLYGTCKNAVHDVLSKAAPGAFSFAWGRIFFLYGPHEHPDRLVPSVIRALLAGEPARTSHGRQVRDYLYVADVADALVRLTDSEQCGAVNIASGQPVPLRDIVTRIGHAIGRSELIQLDAIPQAATDTPFVVGDPTRLMADLGWSPAFTLDAGLAATIDWWRARPGDVRPVAPWP